MTGVIEMRDAVDKGPALRFAGMLMLAVALMTGCAGEVARGSASNAAAREPVTRWLTITGARVAPGRDPSGMPLVGPGPAPFTAFTRPSAVAASGNTVYVADLAPGRVYRFDIAGNSMAVVPAARVQNGTRIAVSRDEFLYVLDPATRRVLQYGRDNRPLLAFADPANLVRPVAFAVDDVRRLVYVADGGASQIIAFHPAGGASFVIALRGDDRNRVVRIGAIALGADAFYVSDPLCRCIARVALDGRVLETFGHQQIGQPGAIAIDRFERIFVADALGSRLKIFSGRKLVHDLPREALGVGEISDLSIDGDMLAIADGAGARVVLLRVSPPEGAQ